MTMQTATKVPKPEVWTSSELCGTSVTGCRQRAEYAVFLLEGGSTVRRVLEYVDPPECKRNNPCDWTYGWKNWQTKESRKNIGHKTSLQNLKVGGEEEVMNGKIRAPYQLNGVSEKISKSSGIYQVIDELLAKELLEEFEVEGKSCQELLTELESLREVITLWHNN